MRSLLSRFPSLRNVPPERGPDAKGSTAPRVLLACRDSATRKWGQRWLAGEDLSVHVAKNEAEALALIDRTRPDIVLVDATLRDDKGQLLIESINARTSDEKIPVVALCSSASAVQRAVDAGVTEILRKPFNWQLAARRIERLVALAKLEDDLKTALNRLQRLEEDAHEGRARVKRAKGFDDLTGLPNKLGFENAVTQALTAGTGQNRGVAVALFDIDRFVLINNTLGRARANSLLQQFAQRMVAALRSKEILNCMSGVTTSVAARVEGDLFGVMLAGIRDRHEAMQIVKILLEQLTVTYQIDGEDILLTSSAGLAIAPDDGVAVEDLIRGAEVGVSEAFKNGGGCARSFDTSNPAFNDRSTKIMRCLQKALKLGEFELYYQPLVSGSRPQVFGAEALLRWKSPELGQVSPAEFIPLAEEAGLMVTIGKWVLTTACRQLRRWIDEGLRPIRMAVNVSIAQLARGDLAGFVRETVRETGIDPCLLELELSERGALRNDPAILRELQEIKELGVRIAVDDFGTGNSAIAYLRQFPFDTLKIDRSYIKGVSDSADDAAITTATIAMAHQLRLDVVAEGVEERCQMEFLEKQGCNEYQGFLFSPPVPSAQFRQLLQNGLTNEQEQPEESSS